jgi:YVTN family beta-propeller protein
VFVFGLDENGDPNLESYEKFDSGIHDLAMNPKNRFIYMTNKFNSLIYTFKLRIEENIEVVSSNDGEAATKEKTATAKIFKTAVLNVPNANPTTDYSRFITFSRDGTYGFVTERSPHSVVVLDLSLKEDGSPKNTIVAEIMVGREPAQPLLVWNETMNRDLLYVPCFRSDNIYVIDTKLMEVMEIIPVGVGPFNSVLIDRPDIQMKQAFFSLFEDHAIAVLELNESSPYYNEVIALIH